METEIRQRVLTESVRKALATGSSVCIFGWNRKNHCEFMKNLPKRKIIFLNTPLRHIPQNSGLVICTKFTSHSDLKRMRKWGEVYPGTVTLSRIKEVLKSCKDLLI